MEADWYDDWDVAYACGHRWHHEFPELYGESDDEDFQDSWGSPDAGGRWGRGGARPVGAETQQGLCPWVSRPGAAGVDVSAGSEHDRATIEALEQALRALRGEGGCKQGAQRGAEPGAPGVARVTPQGTLQSAGAPSARAKRGRVVRGHTFS